MQNKTTFKTFYLIYRFFKPYSPSCSFKLCLKRCRFPFKNTKFSKFASVRHALFGLRTSPAVLEKRSTAAELGSPASYFTNRVIQWSLNFAGNCSFRTTSSLLLFQDRSSLLIISSNSSSPDRRGTTAL